MLAFWSVRALCRVGCHAEGAFAAASSRKAFSSFRLRGGGGFGPFRRLRSVAAGTAAAAVGAAGVWVYVRSTPKAHCVSSLSPQQTKYDAGSFRSDLPTFTWDQIRAHSTPASGIWVVFKNGVYDISDFVSNHPGGSKIKLAAGGSLEPFWELYTVHKSREVYEMLEGLRVGNVVEPPPVQAKPTDEFSGDPERSPAMLVISQRPFNAEPPSELLTESYHTPSSLFFVRNHMPVPDVDVEHYRLTVTGPKGSKTFSLDELKSSFEHHRVAATMQCSGNRRTELSAVRPVKGLAWKTGAISNAEWTGIRLLDVLSHLGYTEDDANIQHVQFEGLDKDTTGTFYGASIPVDMAFNPRADVLLAFEMNGEPLPRDHGFPVRVIVPGVIGARSVKWLSHIVLSDDESQSFWQRKDYKTFSPSVDWDCVDFDRSPPVYESPIQSAICEPLPGNYVEMSDGEVLVKGYAFSGGGRGVVRVDVSIDGGVTWQEAKLDSGGQQLRRSWAWTLWEANLPIPKNHNGSVEIICKAVDASFNVQPDSPAGIWNLRGILNNSWHRVRLNVKD